MRKQSGFTLIELMVVMAIIAILATAGLSAYGGYLKKARDTTRIADMRAINSIVLGALSTSGSSPDLDAVETAIIAMNNGVILEDPMNGLGVCLDSGGGPNLCGYVYAQCNNGGYVLRMGFESFSNVPRYELGQDEMSSDANAPDYYDLGSCDTVTIDTEGTIEE